MRLPGDPELQAQRSSSNAGVYERDIFGYRLASMCSSPVSDFFHSQLQLHGSQLCVNTHFECIHRNRSCQYSHSTVLKVNYMSYPAILHIVTFTSTHTYLITLSLFNTHSISC